MLHHSCLTLILCILEISDSGMQLGASQLCRAVAGIGLLDLVLEIAQLGEQWHACLHYNTDLFDKATAQRMLGHFMVGLSACYAAETHACKSSTTHRGLKVPG